MKKTILSLVSMAFICAMTFTSCSEIMSTIDNPVGSYVQFAKTELTLQPGDVVPNTATTISTETIVYTTSDDKVATVDQNGNITAVAVGEATITASVPGNEFYNAGSATCKVKVAIPVKSVAITAPSTPFVMALGGEDVTLGVVFDPADATDQKVTWSSSKPEVATVDETGKVHAVALGTTTIKVVTTNGKEATVELTVEKPVVDLSKLTAAYEAKDDDILTGETNYAITIAAGATVTLAGATINNYVECLGNANIILKKETVNTITSGSNTALIVGPAGKTLTIDGEGQLDAKTTTSDRCGIGSKSGGESGNIVINGGTIYAMGVYGAAIGACDNGGKIGDITINGGKVTATAGGYYGAAIGSGDSYGGGSTCGNITITGGEVTAFAFNYAPGIGAGGLSQNNNSICGNITITGGKVTATGGQYAAGIGTGYDNKAADSKCGNITISGGTVVATRGADASWDVGPGIVGVVGTVNVTVAVKDADDNAATIYAPGALVPAPRRASANDIQMPEPRR